MTARMIQTDEERIAEMKVCITELREAMRFIDDAREKYLGEHQARHYGKPVSRLLNWMQESLEAIVMIVEDEVNDYVRDTDTL